MIELLSLESLMLARKIGFDADRSQSLSRAISRMASGARWLPLALAASIIGTLITVIGIRIWEGHDRTLREGLRELEILAQVLEEQIAQTIQAVDFTLIGIIDVMRLTQSMSDHNPEFEETLRLKVTMLPYVRALFVIGPDGHMIQDTGYPDTPPATFTDREYFIQHATNPSLGLSISRPLISRATGNWFVGLSRRINNPDGSFGGVVVASLEPRYIESFYRKLTLNVPHTIALYSLDGILIAQHPYPDQMIGKQFDDIRRLQDGMATSPVGTHIAPSFIDGTPLVTSYRRVDNLPLVVTVGQRQGCPPGGMAPQRLDHRRHHPAHGRSNPDRDDPGYPVVWRRHSPDKIPSPPQPATADAGSRE